MHRLSRGFPSTSSNISHVLPFEEDRRPPPDLGKWQNFRVFLYNKERGTVCNRSLVSWCKIISFYAMFILTMVGIFIVVLNVSTNYIRTNYKKPIFEKDSLMYRINPSIGFLPDYSTRSSHLIWYSGVSNNKTGSNTKDSKHRRTFPNSYDYSNYVSYISGILDKYNRATQNRKEYVDCSKVKNSSKPCMFDVSSMGPCGRKPFGYKDKQPCIYLTVSKLPNWKPDYYDTLPNDMPTSLKTVINKSTDKKNLWVYCSGFYPHDVEHLGTISYYPQQGISGYYFPYKSDGDYLSPIVAFKANNIQRGFLIDIRCYLWAKNINSYDRINLSTSIRLYIGLQK